MILSHRPLGRISLLVLILVWDGQFSAALTSQVDNETSFEKQISHQIELAQQQLDYAQQILDRLRITLAGHQWPKADYEPQLVEAQMVGEGLDLAKVSPGSSNTIEQVSEAVNLVEVEPQPDDQTKVSTELNETIITPPIELNSSSIPILLEPSPVQPEGRITPADDPRQTGSQESAQEIRQNIGLTENHSSPQLGSEQSENLVDLARVEQEPNQVEKGQMEPEAEAEAEPEAPLRPQQTPAPAQTTQQPRDSVQDQGSPVHHDDNQDSHVADSHQSEAKKVATFQPQPNKHNNEHTTLGLSIPEPMTQTLTPVQQAQPSQDDTSISLDQAVGQDGRKEEAPVVEVTSPPVVVVASAGSPVSPVERPVAHQVQQRSQTQQQPEQHQQRSLFRQQQKLPVQHQRQHHQETSQNQWAFLNQWVDRVPHFDQQQLNQVDYGHLVPPAPDPSLARSALDRAGNQAKSFLTNIRHPFGAHAPQAIPQLQQHQHPQAHAQIPGQQLGAPIRDFAAKLNPFSGQQEPMRASSSSSSSFSASASARSSAWSSKQVPFQFNAQPATAEARQKHANKLRQLAARFNPVNFGRRLTERARTKKEARNPHQVNQIPSDQEAGGWRERTSELLDRFKQNELVYGTVAKLKTHALPPLKSALSHGRQVGSMLQEGAHNAFDRLRHVPKLHRQEEGSHQQGGHGGGGKAKLQASGVPQLAEMEPDQDEQDELDDAAERGPAGGPVMLPYQRALPDMVGRMANIPLVQPRSAGELAGQLGLAGRTLPVAPAPPLSPAGDQRRGSVSSVVASCQVRSTSQGGRPCKRSFSSISSSKSLAWS